MKLWPLHPLLFPRHRLIWFLLICPAAALTVSPCKPASSNLNCMWNLYKCGFVCVSMFTIWALSSTWSWPDPLRPFPRSNVCWDTLCLTGAGLWLARTRPGVPTGWDTCDTWNKGRRGERREAKPGRALERGRLLLTFLETLLCVQRWKPKE